MTRSLHSTSAGSSSRPREFVAIIGLLMGLVALSIDVILPALGLIALEFGLGDDNRRQWLITALFIGLAFGQLLYGPLSDSLGRKPAIYIGLAWFALGSVLSVSATNFEWMLVGRLLQNFGAAGPRIVTVAMVRDRFQGAAMARIMSLIMSIFILVPIFAPALGQALLWVVPWRVLFLLVLVIRVERRFV